MSVEMSNVDQWRLDAAEKQQEFYTRLGDREWDVISIGRRDQMLDKISGSYFSREYNECSAEQKKAIENVVNKVLELSGSNELIYLGFVYVCILTKDERNPNIFAVIRTKPRYQDTIYFVEPHSMRVYTEWTDYKNNNTLPECWMCFPINGFYTSCGNRVELEFEESPACRKILKFVDAVASVGTIASTAMLGVSTVMFPPLLAIQGPAIFALVAGGGYTVGRTVSQLYDRGSHHQSVSPLDNGALPIWLSMIANIGSTALGSYAAVSVVLGRKGASLMAAILRYASIGVNSFGAVLCVCSLVIKFMNGTLTHADVDHLVFLAFFIANVIITHTTAKRVIKLVAEEPHRIKNLFNMVANTEHQVLKTLMSSESLVNVITYLTGPVVIMILRQCDMPHVARALEGLKSTGLRLIRGSMSVFEFMKHTVSTLYPFLTELRIEIAGAIEKLQKLLNKPYNYIVINWIRLFQHSSPARMAQIMQHIEEPVNGLVYNPEILDNLTKVMLDFAMKMAERVNCETDRDFSNLCSFLAEKVTRAYDSRSSVAAAEGHPATLERDKEKLFVAVIAKLDLPAARFQLIDEFSEIRRIAVETQLIFEQPVYQSSDMTLHHFITSSEVRSFDQFVYDAACELLDTEQLFEDATMDLKNSLFVIQFHEKVLFFFFEIDKKKDEVEGMAVLNGGHSRCALCD